MSDLDLRLRALRLKVVEMLRRHAERQTLVLAAQRRWRRQVAPN